MTSRVPQPTPSVTESDVVRIVRRDYSADAEAAILELIARVDVREKPRVVLACLKIADGDLEKLQGNLANASGWYREILAEAEYPLATKRWFRIDSLSEDEVRSIYDKDWRQVL